MNCFPAQKREIGLMGISLGGSPATNLAVKHNSKALALISSVDSIREEIKSNLKVHEVIISREINWQCIRVYSSKANQMNQSPKGYMWSAIHVALLCLAVCLIKGKQGSSPEGNKVL